MLLSEGHVSDYKGAALLINALPKAKALLADRGYDAEWFLTHTQTYEGTSPASDGTPSYVLRGGIPGSGTASINESTLSTSGTIDEPQKETNSIPITENRSKGLQFDILLPLFERDDNVRAFAARLKPTLKAYQRETETKANVNVKRITTFRLLLTRYTQAEINSIPQLKDQLVQILDLPPDNIVMIPVHNEYFQRSSACNTLMASACHETNCLVARIDVDMHILPEFFVHSVDHIQTPKTAYFPIVWSEYNPQSVQLVQEYMDNQAAQRNTPKQKLERYSDHRGHWRSYGTGMYVLSGPDAAHFKLDENFKGMYSNRSAPTIVVIAFATHDLNKSSNYLYCPPIYCTVGWGGEDGNFYTLVKAQRNIVREEEPGLIHTWHGKKCRPGKDGKSCLVVQWICSCCALLLSQNVSNTATSLWFQFSPIFKLSNAIRVEQQKRGQSLAYNC
jgi:hypothetical protein